MMKLSSYIKVVLYIKQSDIEYLINVMHTLHY